ncbi:MAG: hypothetical protein NUW37_01895 [Planctomycetes bacterium]|nr:hypothetical protein [Planctomycetota bacterium]
MQTMKLSFTIVVFAFAVNGLVTPEAGAYGASSHLRIGAETWPLVRDEIQNYLRAFSGDDSAQLGEEHRLAFIKGSDAPDWEYVAREMGKMNLGWVSSIPRSIERGRIEIVNVPHIFPQLHEWSHSDELSRALYETLAEGYGTEWSSVDVCFIAGYTAHAAEDHHRVIRTTGGDLPSDGDAEFMINQPLDSAAVEHGNVERGEVDDERVARLLTRGIERWRGAANDAPDEETVLLAIRNYDIVMGGYLDMIETAAEVNRARLAGRALRSIVNLGVRLSASQQDSTRALGYLNNLCPTFDADYLYRDSERYERARSGVADPYDWTAWSTFTNFWTSENTALWNGGTFTVEDATEYVAEEVLARIQWMVLGS